MLIFNPNFEFPKQKNSKFHSKTSYSIHFSIVHVIKRTFLYTRHLRHVNEPLTVNHIFARTFNKRKYSHTSHLTHMNSHSRVQCVIHCEQRVTSKVKTEFHHQKKNGFDSKGRACAGRFDSRQIRPTLLSVCQNG